MRDLVPMPPPCRRGPRAGLIDLSRCAVERQREQQSCVVAAAEEALEERRAMARTRRALRKRGLRLKTAPGRVLAVCGTSGIVRAVASDIATLEGWARR